MKVKLPTLSETKLIHSGDRDLINRYYLANYELIKALARGYCRAVNRYSECMDFAHEVYLNFD